MSYIKQPLTLSVQDRITRERDHSIERASIIKRAIGSIEEASGLYDFILFLEVV
ncbi:hypothetical protein [Bacillus smithii]|uniref:hypothetical protein n=1 Tax=Bacillus smithii TaxID=1479 RepID=UPI003D1911B7